MRLQAGEVVGVVVPLKGQHQLSHTLTERLRSLQLKQMTVLCCLSVADSCRALMYKGSPVEKCHRNPFVTAVQLDTTVTVPYVIN